MSLMLPMPRKLLWTETAFVVGHVPKGSVYVYGLIISKRSTHKLPRLHFKYQALKEPRP